MGVSSLTVKEDVSALRRRMFYIHHQLSTYYFDISELENIYEHQKKEKKIFIWGL